MNVASEILVIAVCLLSVSAIGTFWWAIRKSREAGDNESRMRRLIRLWTANVIFMTVSILCLVWANFGQIIKAEFGNVKAQKGLWAYYSPENEVQASKWLLKAAEQGDGEAEWLMGYACSVGKGVPQDDTKAVEWYRKSAESGYLMGLHTLADCYHEGKGTARDDGKSAECIQTAADWGMPISQQKLAEYFRDGIGVSKDYVRSYMWFTLAGQTKHAPGKSADETSKELEAQRESLRAQMSPEQVAEAEKLAREWKPKPRPNGASQPTPNLRQHQKTTNRFPPRADKVDTHSERQSEATPSGKQEGYAVDIRSLVSAITNGIRRLTAPKGRTSNVPDSSGCQLQTQIEEDILTSAAWISKALTSSGYRADFTMESFRDVDRFFEEHSKDGQPVPGGLLSEDLGPRLFTLGAYVGETIRRQCGGKWVGDDDDPEVEFNVVLQFPNKGIIWPIQRVMKRFKNGEEDSIYDYGRYVTKEYGKETHSPESAPNS